MPSTTIYVIDLLIVMIVFDRVWARKKNRSDRYSQKFYDILKIDSWPLFYAICNSGTITTTCHNRHNCYDRHKRHKCCIRSSNCGRVYKNIIIIIRIAVLDRDKRWSLGVEKVVPTCVLTFSNLIDTIPPNFL